MSLFPCSVSPREASLQGPEEPSRRLSPNEPWGLLAAVGRGRQAALGAHGVGSWAGSLLSRGTPRGRRLQFNPRAPLIPISVVSGHDARLGRGCFLVLGGFISFPFFFFLKFYLIETKGEMLLIHEFSAGACRGQGLLLLFSCPLRGNASVEPELEEPCLPAPRQPLRGQR